MPIRLNLAMSFNTANFNTYAEVVSIQGVNELLQVSFKDLNLSALVLHCY